MTRTIGRLAMALAFGGCILTAGPASAQTNITAGGSVTPPPTMSLSSILGSGYTVEDTQTLSGGNGSGVAFSLTAEAVKLSSGTYDFLFQVTNTGSQPIDSLNVTNYSLYSTAVAQANNGSTLAPFVNGTVGSYDADLSGGQGATLTYNLGTSSGTGDLAPGSTSLVMVLATDARAYDTFGTATGASLTLNAGSFALNGVVEPAAVPEPGSLVLGGLALVSAAGVYGFRRIRGR